MNHLLHVYLVFVSGVLATVVAISGVGWGGVRQRRSLAFVACGTDGMLSGFAHATDATLTMGWVWGGVGQ